MSHILAFGGQHFRVEITEVVTADKPEKSVYVSWCSEAFRELKDAPGQSLSRFIDGPSLPSYAEARRHAHDWIKANRATPRTKGTNARRGAAVIFTVWLFKGEMSSGYQFDEYSDAKSFAQAAERSSEITKVGITDNESPEYLAIWEKGP